ncbi:hypothetical protein PRN20_22310 [Devosia sp. ZB163]|uniref:hypothetical protein n=1 Tax=Devosia sp. ZB163 TaxID=3025938 RepID=UPI0023617950|nr:hypothetical protein [Devosia sp. ZB163]MDC9826480.1 hypothetical protein [Devosia sp. ZB163]
MKRITSLPSSSFTKGVAAALLFSAASIVAVSTAAVTPAKADGWVNTQCVVFLSNQGQIAVVNARTFEACQSAGKKCAQDVGISWTNITFYTNWAAVASNPSNYTCTLAY